MQTFFEMKIKNYFFLNNPFYPQAKLFQEFFLIRTELKEGNIVICRS